MRWLLLGASLLVLAAAGWLAFRAPRASQAGRSARIIGASMAPRLLGPHVRLDCEACRFSWPCPLDCLPDDDQFVCPNCCRTQSLTPSPPLPGDEVRVAPQPPVRLGLVALRGGDGLQIKRVAGLPGELVEIRAGDLWINGRVLQKTWPEFLDQAILVHDADFPGEAVRWRPDPPGNPLWRWDPRSLTWSGEAGESASRLMFEPCVPAVSQDASGAGPSWTDVYAENQGLSRVWQAARDIVCEAELLEAGDAALQLELELRTVDGHLRWRCEPASGAAECWLDDLPLPLESLRPAGGSTPRRLAWGVWDRQAALVLDDRLAARAALPDRTAATEAAQAAVACVRGTVRLRRLRILRDIHYLPKVPDSPWSLQLGPDQFAVLGDNQPYAIDSRYYGAVERASLLGVAAPPPGLAGEGVEHGP